MTDEQIQNFLQAGVNSASKRYEHPGPAWAYTAGYLQSLCFRMMKELVAQGKADVVTNELATMLAIMTAQRPLDS